MDILEPKSQIVTTTSHYKTMKLFMNLDKIHLIEKMELHRQTRGMVFGDLIC